MLSPTLSWQGFSWMSSWVHPPIFFAVLVPPSGSPRLWAAAGGQTASSGCMDMSSPIPTLQCCQCLTIIWSPNVPKIQHRLCPSVSPECLGYRWTKSTQHNGDRFVLLTRNRNSALLPTCWEWTLWFKGVVHWEYAQRRLLQKVIVDTCALRVDGQIAPPLSLTTHGWFVYTSKHGTNKIHKQNMYSGSLSYQTMINHRGFSGWEGNQKSYSTPVHPPQ